MTSTQLPLITRDEAAGQLALLDMYGQAPRLVPLHIARTWKGAVCFVDALVAVDAELYTVPLGRVRMTRTGWSVTDSEHFPHPHVTGDYLDAEAALIRTTPALDA